MSNYFNDNGYIIQRNVINEQTLKLLKAEIKLTEQLMCFNQNQKIDNYFFNDTSCKKSFSIYSMMCSEALLNIIQPIIENVTNLKLFPTYSYTRIYYKNSILHKHTDRNECEISATVCILTDKDKPWDIYLFDKNKNKVCVTLFEGDILIYKGIELEHWREEYTGEQQIQIFLHYVNKYGNFSNLKYDGRYLLGSSKSHEI